MSTASDYTAFTNKAHALGWSVETAGPIRPRVRVHKADVSSPWFPGYSNPKCLAWIERLSQVTQTTERTK